jgi:hypothetical protein
MHDKSEYDKKLDQVFQKTKQRPLRKVFIKAMLNLFMAVGAIVVLLMGLEKYN